MKDKIKIKCPAKINLDLRVYPLDKKTGFHPIKSIMQAINLFDYLLIENNKEIVLSGNSSEIPYDENNLCYRAAKLFFDNTRIKNGCKIYIEKNIPVAAGLAGGSSDAMGVLFGLNKMFDYPLSLSKLNEIASTLGSDLNFCLVGGTKLCTGRGEKIIDMPFYNFKLTLIKPKNLKISAKQAYLEFDKLKEESNLRNDLEFALIKSNKYDEINYLHSLGLQMSGSGATFFLREKELNISIDEEKFLVIRNLNSIDYGVCESEC